MNTTAIATGTTVTITNLMGTETATVHSHSNPRPGELRTYVVRYADNTYGHVNERQVQVR